MVSIFPADLIPFASTFLFIFAIGFAMMSYSSVLKSKAASAVVAAVIAFFAATFEPLVAFMTAVMPIAAGALVVLFFLVFLREVVFKGKHGKSLNLVPAAIGLALSLLIVSVIWQQVLQAYGIVGVLAENIVYIFAVVALIIVFWVGYKSWGGTAPAGAPPPGG